MSQTIEYTYTRQSYRTLGDDALQPMPPQGDNWQLVAAAIAGTQTIVFWWRREKEGSFIQERKYPPATRPKSQTNDK